MTALMHTNPLFPSFKTISTATIAALMLSTSALALEGKALVDSYIAKVAVSGTTITYSAADVISSDSVLLNEVSISDGSKPPLLIDSIRFDQFKSVGNDRVTIGALTITGMEGPTSDGGNGSVGSITLTNADLPADPVAATMAENIGSSGVSFGKLEMKAFDIKSPSANVTIETVSLRDAEIPFKWDYEAAKDKTSKPMILGGTEITGTRVDSPAGNFSMEYFELGRMRIPTSMPDNIFEWVELYSSLNITKMDFSMGGKQIVALGSLTAKLSGDKSSGLFTSSSAINDIFVNLAAIPDPQFNYIRQQLGYDTLDGSMSGDGSWNAKTGRAELANTNITFKNVGTLQMDYAITGYTAELAQKIQEVQMQAAGSGNPQMAMMQVMPLLEKIKLESFTFNFTDDSLTKRLLKFQASQMGQTPEALAGAAPMFIQMGMQGLNMPGFSQMVASAVGAFLSNPGNLSISSRPATPVALSEIVGAGMAAPQTVPDLLKIEIKANN